MSEQATPRPWRWSTEYHDEITAGTDPPVLTVWGYDFEMNWRNEEADAALIVRAVNAHDDLVAALRALVGALTYGDLFDGPQPAQEPYEQARALLEKISG